MTYTYTSDYLCDFPNCFNRGNDRAPLLRSRFLAISFVLVQICHFSASISALIKLRISPIDFSENQRSCSSWKQARHDAVHIPHANSNLSAGPPQSPTTLASSSVLQLLYNTHLFPLLSLSLSKILGFTSSPLGFHPNHCYHLWSLFCNFGDHQTFTFQSILSHITFTV